MWDMRRISISRWSKAGLILATMLSSVQAVACPLCYAQASSAGERMIHALRSGITALVVPPLAVCLGIGIISYRKRNQFNDSERED
jgi:hypothetical protein